MIYLGSPRIVTNSFQNHKTAEDYAGTHQSDIKINGTGKVIRIIDHFQSYEDSIDYYDFLDHKNDWQDGNHYNCISVTGKMIRMQEDELKGNQIWIETKQGNKTLLFHFAHLDSISVQVGDVVNSDTVVGKQGNTGLVLSNKSKSDSTYGSHVHFEVIDSNRVYLNPREYADGTIETSYLEQSEESDEVKEGKLQDPVVPNIIIEDQQQTPLEKSIDQEDNILIFTCEKEDYYYIKLYPGEKLYLKK